MWVRIAAFGLLLAAGEVTAQGPNHLSVGVCVRGDFNADGCDDVLVVPVADMPRIFYGSRVFPHIVPGPRMPVAKTKPVDIPVFTGGHLYVPMLDPTTGQGLISVLAPDKTGKMTPVSIVRLAPSQALGTVTSLKITALDQDLDGDGGKDLVAVWGELPASRSCAYHFAYIAKAGIVKSICVPKISNQPGLGLITDVLKSFNAQNRRSEFLVTISGEALAAINNRGGRSALVEPDLSGFGVQAIGQGPVARGAVWFSGVARLARQGRVLRRSSSSFGAFQPVPQLGVPVLKVAWGPSVLLRPLGGPPFVQPAGEILSTSPGGITVDACTADYDGDGHAEMVWFEFLHSKEADLVVVADPGSGRAYIQIFDFARAPGFRDLVPYHATSGDFDGDGDLDILLDCSPRNQRGSNFALLLNTPVAGKPSLKRVY